MVKIYVKDFGVMTFKMDYDNAPNTAANFVQLAYSGFYDGLTFHRIIKGFMIQGGNGEFNAKYVDYTIKGEFASNGVTNNLKHKRGVISMARTSVKDSASTQFFIVHRDAPHLDGDYASFGTLVEGEDVLDKIAAVQTDYNDAPLKRVIIEKCEVIDEPMNPVLKQKEF
ncbi:MAG: peptidylprolyl isomerase [Bacilli bacterium]|jgi:peptidyl-prolyl cis-trans isomerase B (cyclophilin B)|nr:peptidylprolyl isomerase [Bacilli bacterium]